MSESGIRLYLCSIMVAMESDRHLPSIQLTQNFSGRRYRPSECILG